MPNDLVLASSSRARAAVLDDAGIKVLLDSPDIDERALDALLDEEGPAGLAIELARRKAQAVAPRHPGTRVIAADQVGVLVRDGASQMLTKQPDEDGAVAQLMSMSGGTHELVNGVVVLDVDSGRLAEGVDRQVVTMRHLSAGEVRDYVRRFAPYESAGSYRLEDQERMAPLEPFVTGVSGEHDSGVLGMPLPLLRRLLASLDRG